MKPRVIVNADDFGRSREINAAILQAHREGILTSASLMVAGDAASEAIEIARATPSLAVGLHLTLVKGRAVLPPSEIPHIADFDGQFLPSPVAASRRYSLDKTARAEVQREIRAQFGAFAATGLPLSHVDGHLHMHMHPAAMEVALELAAAHKASGFRIPRDRLLVGLRHDRRRLAGKAVWASFFEVMSRRFRAQLLRAGFVVPERAYGLVQSGQMRERYVVGVIEQLREPIAEIYFHPTTGERLDPFGPNRDDLETLLSPNVRRAIEERGIELTTYPACAI